MNAPVPEPNLQPARWRFGDAELDEFRLEIVRAGESVAVESKSLELLRVFVRHPGEVLTKDELMDAVWPGRVLSESVLARSVSLLRRAIGDGGQSVIRTVHGYGYRFDAAVERLTPVRTQSAAALHLQSGEQPPLRPNWKLVERLGEGRNETWLVEHDKTRERRVFKFAGDGAGLSTLKREITLQRLLTESLGERAAVVPVLDWNLQQPPYFIETEWCPAGSLESWLGAHPDVGPEIRVELVAQAAEALAAAHAVGVLHKDVKPANLLVVETGGRPAIRLADFGSGALVDDTRLQALSITRLGLTREINGGDSSGSLMYLAPEVIAGQPATLRSDVYALGVLLYQLIVGDLRRPLAPGWERDVTDPLLREDIAAAAELNPARRLAEAGQLAQRLRALDGRRLQLELDRAEAQRSEQARRQIERWRAQRGWVFAAIGALTLGLALSTGLYLAARQARDQARHAEASASAVNQFLLDDLLAATDPEISGRPDITVRELLTLATVRAGERLKSQPGVEAELRKTLGSALYGLGSYTQAAEELRKSLQLTDAGDPAQRMLIAGAHLELARTLLEMDRIDEARTELQAVIDLSSQTPGGMPLERLSARTELAALERRAAHYEAALKLLDELEPQVQMQLGAETPLSLKIGRYRADVLCDLGRIDDCVSAYQRNLAVRERISGPHHPETFLIRRLLSNAYIHNGRFEAGLPMAEQLYAEAREFFGPTHRLTLASTTDLASALQMKGETRRAEQLYKDNLEAQGRVLGPEHSDTQMTRASLAYLYFEAGRYKEALALHREVLAIQIRTLGEDSTETITTRHNVGRALQELGRWQEAAEVQRHAVELGRAKLPASHWSVAPAMYALARSLGMLGRYDEAEALFDEAIARLDAARGIDPKFALTARRLQAEMRQRRQRSLAN